MSSLTTGTARLRDAVIGSDPGLLRLRTAGTTTAAMLASLAVMTGVAQLLGQPLTVVLLGVVISLIASIAVTDPEPAQQRVTTLLLPLPAAAAVSLGALLAPHRVLGDVVFVLVMVAAAAVRRCGPRGTALGMVGFMAYFFALFLGARPAQIPSLVLALGVGTAVSLVLRGYLLPERGERVLRRTVRAFRARAGSVVDVVREQVAAGGAGKQITAGGAGKQITAGSAERSRRRLRARLTRLNETALLVSDRLEGTDARDTWPGLDSRTLALRVLDAELAVERLAAVAVRLVAADELPTAVRGRLVGALVALRGTLGQTTVPDPLADGGGSELARRFGSVIHAVSVAMAASGPAAGSADTTLPDVLPAEAVDEPSDDESSDDVHGSGGWHPTTRQAVQVGVATSLSIVAGELISPSRWYWAVIAAFVVFAGTTSRGEILSRGWQRVLGTLAGVVGGVGLAVLLGGHPAASVVGIFVCVFFAFYLFQISQALMMFWITAMLALLYGLLGQFSVSVLVVRLEETAAGAAIGVLVAYLVLPTSTRATVTGHVEDFLVRLDGLLDRAVPVLAGAAPAAELLLLARELDDTLRTLRTSAKPLTAGLAGLRGRPGVRRLLRTLTACDRYARGVARLAGSTGAAMPAPGCGWRWTPCGTTWPRCASGWSTSSARRSVRPNRCWTRWRTGCRPRRRTWRSGPPWCACSAGSTPWRSTSPSISTCRRQRPGVRPAGRTPPLPGDQAPTTCPSGPVGAGRAAAATARAYRVPAASNTTPAPIMNAATRASRSSATARRRAG